MVDLICYKCKTKIHLHNDDLIKIGRQQIIYEINKLIERLRNEKNNN